MGRSLSSKILVIWIIGGICFGASLLVLALVNERAGRYAEAAAEMASTWGKRQLVVGPMLVVQTKSGLTYILPETVQFDVTLDPQVRSRGIFRSTVYSGVIKVSGEFSGGSAIRSTGQRAGILSVAITDTRGIEKQVPLLWNGDARAFEPGPGSPFQDGSGVHAAVPISNSKIPFSFELAFRGSEGISIAPVGNETQIRMSSPWRSPSFSGSFLPSTREIGSSGFSAEWNVSSFGRPYPQKWENMEVSLQEASDSAVAVNLHTQVDEYAKIFRSIKYAILFIIVTFAAFFLFEVLAGLRIHPVQYAFVGAALAIFYLLLLSFSEQIGFLAAYALATVMTAALITAYCVRILNDKKRVLIIVGILIILYGYLYFVLSLEDYALLFGSLLLFVLLAGAMYLTRNVDWFALEDKSKVS